MFEIILFLFEHYSRIDSAPDRGTLAIKLNAAGFEGDEIEQVLDWLGALDSINGGNYPASLADSTSIRCYTAEELRQLGTDGVRFLMFLQQSGVINALQREWIINQAIATDDDERLDESLRWITLMVLWHQHPDQNIVLLEDMLFQQHAVPTLH